LTVIIELKLIIAKLRVLLCHRKNITNKLNVMQPFIENPVLYLDIIKQLTHGNH